MKVLLFAYSCCPQLGSEAAVGWKAATALARQHRVHVITCAGMKRFLEEARTQGRIPDTLTFHFIGEPPRWHPNRMIARLQSWNYFRRDMRHVLPLAQRLHAEHQFDLSHHVTIATWRIGSPLWQLPIPFVWGPIGGVSSMPSGMRSILSTSSRCFEGVREIAGRLGQRSRGVVNCAKGAAVVVASNSETAAFIRRIRGTDQGIETLSATFFTTEHLMRFSDASKHRDAGGLLRLFAGGNQIGTKGVSLALMALGHASRRALAFQYTIGGGGPEIPHLMKLSKRLGLTSSVRFSLGFAGDDYARELGGSHVFFMPSFRENAPVTIMEAMLSGCVPLVADWSAQGEIVTPECGIGVPVSTPGQMAEDFAQHLLALNTDRARLASLGAAARRRIENGYSEAHYLERLAEIYDTALRRHRS